MLWVGKCTVQDRPLFLLAGYDLTLERYRGWGNLAISNQLHQFHPKISNNERSSCWSPSHMSKTGRRRVSVGIIAVYWSLLKVFMQQGLLSCLIAILKVSFFNLTIQLVTRLVKNSSDNQKITNPTSDTWPMLTNLTSETSEQKQLTSPCTAQVFSPDYCERQDGGHWQLQCLQIPRRHPAPWIVAGAMVIAWLSWFKVVP